MATYNPYSPYYKTQQTNDYLDILNFRNIPSQNEDVLFEITSTYENRPDLLAYDLYKDIRLWWVFAVRNKETLKDPIFDMKPGTKIYLPKLSSIKKVLGN